MEQPENKNGHDFLAVNLEDVQSFGSSVLSKRVDHDEEQVEQTTT